MFNSANQTHFSLSIEGLAHDLQVLEFSGREAISQPFASSWSWSASALISTWKACCTSRPFSLSRPAATAFMA